jgi:hypothetical protein
MTFYLLRMMKTYQCSESGSGSVGSVCFWASRIRIRIRSRSYESEDPDPHPDPYQNVTDPQQWFEPGLRSKLIEKISEKCIPNK